MCEGLVSAKEDPISKDLRDVRDRLRALEDHLKIRLVKPYGYQVRENKVLSEEVVSSKF